MRKTMMIAFLLLTANIPLTMKGASPDPRAEIEAFNRKLENATRLMDNTATLALWAEDGISLLPSTKPTQLEASMPSGRSESTVQE